MRLPFFLSAVLHAAAFVWLYAHWGAFTAFDISGTNLETNLEIVVSPTGSGAIARSNTAKRALPREPVASADPSAIAPVSAVASAPVSAVSEPESENAVAAAFSRNRAPEYPRVSRLRGEEGRVVVSVVIAKDGTRIAPARAKLSSGFENLDRAAVASVETWSFSPLEHSERLDLEIPFVFRLEEKR